MKKSNRKGFTLIELIAVVVILGVIALIAVPAVTYYLSGAQNDAYKIAEQNLAEAAYNMFADCAGVGDLAVCDQYSVPDSGGYVTVPASVLIANGYLDPIADSARQGSYCDENNSFAIIMNDATETDFNAKLSYKACLSCSKYQSTDCNFESNPTDRIDNPADFTVNQCENFEDHLTTYGIDLRAQVILHGESVERYVMPSPSTVDTTQTGTFNLNYAYGGLTAITRVTVKDISKPTSPVVTMTANGASYDGRNWTGSNVVVSFASTDNTSCSGMVVDGSGIKEFMYSKDGGASWTTVASGYTETETFNGNVLVKTVDNDGNESDTTTFHMMVDKTAPRMINATLTTVDDGRGYTQGATTYQDVHIELEGIDDHSGFQKFIYSTDGGTTWRDVPSNWTINETTNTTFRVKAVDNVGNRSTNTVTFTIRINKNFTVSYNANGGTVSPTSKTVVYGSTYGALATPTRTGYAFAGWYTSATGGTQVTSTTKVSQHQNHTIYARWDTNDYTVTFNGNSGTPSYTSKTVTFDSMYGSLPTASRVGYTFLGWYTAQTGGTLVTSSTKVAIAGNHTLYARWRANTLTVYYDANGGSVSPSSKNVIYDGTYGTLARPSRAGYTFLGWYTSRSGGTKVTSSTKVTTSANHKLYAHWTTNSYTLDINPDNNSYGANAGAGARVTSFNVRVVDANGSTVLTQNNISDFNQGVPFNSTIYITGITYKKGYVYNGYGNTNIQVVSASSTSITLKATVASNSSFSINTKGTCTTQSVSVYSDSYAEAWNSGFNGWGHGGESNNNNYSGTCFDLNGASTFQIWTNGNTVGRGWWSWAGGMHPSRGYAGIYRSGNTGDRRQMADRTPSFDGAGDRYKEGTYYYSDAGSGLLYISEGTWCLYAETHTSAYNDENANKCTTSTHFGVYQIRICYN